MATKPPVARKWTSMQQRYLDAYAGNATAAAKTAGHKHPGMAGPRLMENDEMVKAIQEREKKRRGSDIAAREDRQKPHRRAHFFQVSEPPGSVWLG